MQSGVKISSTWHFKKNSCFFFYQKLSPLRPHHVTPICFKKPPHSRKLGVKFYTIYACKLHFYLRFGLDSNQSNAAPPPKKTKKPEIPLARFWMIAMVWACPTSASAQRVRDVYGCPGNSRRFFDFRKCVALRKYGVQRNAFIICCYRSNVLS